MSAKPTSSAPPDAATPPAISPVATPMASGMKTPTALRTPRAICSLERSSVTARRTMRRSPTSGIVAGRDPLRPVEVELALGAVDMRLDRVEQVGDMVAGREAVEDPAREPVAARVEHRRAARALGPRTAGELVGVVARLGAEELGQVGAVRGHQVDGEHVGAAR